MKEEEPEQRLGSNRRLEACGCAFPRGSTVTLGNFDGVHLGHQALVKRLLEVSNKKNLPSVLVTYFPNPAIVLGKNKNLKSVYPEEKKKEILARYNIDYLVTIPFTDEFSGIHAYEFIKNILIARFHAKHVIIGYNHFFGKGREGDFEFLKKHSEEFGYEVEKIEPIFLEEVKVSSSLLRSFIQEGNISMAAGLMGRPFSLKGEVIHGAERGRKINFPTANILSPHDTIRPGIGVYAGYVQVPEGKFRAMTNVGNNPTFGENPTSIEAHILDYSGDLYGKTIEVFFLEKIREEKKFSSVEELISQLEKDREFTISNVSLEK